MPFRRMHYPISSKICSVILSSPDAIAFEKRSNWSSRTANSFSGSSSRTPRALLKPSLPDLSSAFLPVQQQSSSKDQKASNPSPLCNHRILDRRIHPLTNHRILSVFLKQEAGPISSTSKMDSGTLWNILFLNAGVILLQFNKLDAILLPNSCYCYTQNLPNEQVV